MLHAIRLLQSTRNWNKPTLNNIPEGTNRHVQQNVYKKFAGQTFWKRYQDIASS